MRTLWDIGAGRQTAGRHPRGFTLVEVVATSVILLIGAMGVLALTRTGRQMDITTMHRRSARNVAVAELENSRYHFERYDDLKIAPGQETRTVSLDVRGTPADSTDDLTGTMVITVGAEQTETYNTVDVPFIPVTVTVSWNEPEGQETITLIKRITDLE